jgi:Na+-driven multidrug efflux pump
MVWQGVTIRVGHLLAERKIHTAKVVAKAGMTAGACTLCMATALVYTEPVKNTWKFFFTPTAEDSLASGETETMAGVLADIDLIWPSVMLFLIVDGL